MFVLLNSTKREPDNKKVLGEYYTPESLANAIANRVIRKHSVKILDPSFGKGSLLKASWKKLQALGSEDSSSNIFGFDIQEESRNFVLNEMPHVFCKDNLITLDFLKAKPLKHFEDPFDLILSNPPYTRHHDLSESRLDAAREAMEEVDIDLSGLASYWAYFIAHSLRFLTNNGRLAVLLPVAFLDAEYSQSVRNLVKESFSQADVHVLNHDYFQEAQEHVIFLDARGFRGIRDSISCSVRTILNGIDKSKQSAKTKSTKGWSVKAAILGKTPESLINESMQHDHIVRLEEIADIGIGVVTGANNYFILSQKERDSLGLSDDFSIKIIRKSSWLTNTNFCSEDWKSNVDEATKGFLLYPSNPLEIPVTLESYFEEGKKNDIHLRYHCKNRKPWYLVKNTYIPDAFLRYMSSGVPYLTLNNYNATCTNTIHRIKWKSSVSSKEIEIASIASITSLFGLAAETYGRALGGGLLKIEIGAASKLPLAIPKYKPESSLKREIDDLLRSGNQDAARHIADRALLENTLGFSQQIVESLSTAYEALRHSRLGRK